MIITSYILAPLVGGVIGYVTNDIAIRMLFRPHTAKHIMDGVCLSPLASYPKRRDG